MALLVVVLMLALDELVTLVRGGDVCTDDACDKVCLLGDKYSGGSCIIKTSINAVK